MKETGVKNPKADLSRFGFSDVKLHWNWSREALIDKTVALQQGEITDTGALAVDTGEFTGRSPKDKFTVKDDITAGAVDWNAINIPFGAAQFDRLLHKMVTYVQGKELWVRDVSACADPAYRTNVRVITETPWANLFADNMFLRPTDEEKLDIIPEWHILQVPSFMADPDSDGTRQHNFAAIDFTKKCIIIGGTAYTGEIKKGIFTILNFVLPHQKQVLSMHCSANIGEKGDTALFFGLSGTGKTTLSADPVRKLIGDDEHGWSDYGVFNFEGGCYAKCVDLSEEKEPDIFRAIKQGAILENIGYYEDTHTVNYEDISRTENTRVSYPLYHINNIAMPSVGKAPANIFFLSYDAFGVLPPISRLSENQAMYWFISGYTSKVAGTEAGIKEPQPSFSACFGAAFLPLHPARYAAMLGDKIKSSGARVWLVNTGMTGGPYGVGSRMSLKYTRSLITAALTGALDQVDYETIPVFNLQVPVTCPGVPSEILNPRNTWADADDYDNKANELAGRFVANFDKYADLAGPAIISAAPLVLS